MMRIGAIAMVDAADNLAQNNPSGLEYEAMNAVSGAALAAVRLSVQKASFQARMPPSMSEGPWDFNAAVHPGELVEPRRREINAH